METPEVAVKPEQSTFTCEFKGNTHEYFKIWIVNIALTICTLGIYSAWAKVRTRRYFETHTFVNGANFDYHANPLSILKGRLIMGALFLTYTVGGKISPAFSGVAAVLFTAVFPWILVRSMIFNLSNTSYRGVRFGFDGSVKESYRVYLKTILFTIVTFGFGYPKTVEWNKKYLIDHSRYGKSRFLLNLQNESFFPIYYQSILFYLMAAIPTGVIAFIITKIATAADPTLGKMMIGFSLVFVFYLSAIVAWSFIFASSFILEGNHLEIGPFKTKAGNTATPLLFVYITNILACAFTLGLLYPWARVRLTKEKLKLLVIEGPAAGVDTFESGELAPQGASADAASDFFNIDLGF
jgi:uncharacterized membrane protein YjgN (DUF898 family)